MKKIIIALMALMITVGLVGIGTYAVFSDTETSLGNTFTAGTLDLKVDGKDDGETVIHFEIPNMKPGDKWWYTFKLKNTGTIPGQPWVEFSAITNNENGRTEPEITEGDTGDPGELGGKINASIWNGLTPKTWWYSNPLNTFGGKKFGGSTDPTYVYPSIGENEEVKFSLELEIPSKVGNIIQSDSVVFDITFHLDQS